MLYSLSVASWSRTFFSVIFPRPFLLWGTRCFLLFPTVVFPDGRVGGEEPCPVLSYLTTHSLQEVYVVQQIPTFEAKRSSGTWSSYVPMIFPSSTTQLSPSPPPPFTSLPLSLPFLIPPLSLLFPLLHRLFLIKLQPLCTLKHVPERVRRMLILNPWKSHFKLRLGSLIVCWSNIKAPRTWLRFTSLQAN